MVNGALPPQLSETAVLSERTSASAVTVAAIGAGLCTVTLPLTAQPLSTFVADALTVKPTAYCAPEAIVTTPLSFAVFVSDQCQSRVYEVDAVFFTSSDQTIVEQPDALVAV